MIPTRSSGVLLHISSLPSRFGIGDLGPEAYKFADFMDHAGLKYWQILPLNPVEGGSGYSPYSGLSAFAGYPMLISPELLVKEQYVSEEDIQTNLSSDYSKVNYEEVIPFKVQVLEKAFEHFEKAATLTQELQFEDFCQTHSYWLDDFALYMAVKNDQGGQSWAQWPEGLRNREKESLQEYQEKLQREIKKEKFLQFIFFQQWEALQQYCQQKNIHFFGDLPFYVGYDSADVWSHPSIFKLKKDKSPEAVAGVPPDYFSQTGQLWGMPVFDWNAIRLKKYKWWMQRLSHNLHMFDLIRLDHFRAFSAYWEVPAEDTTAINGQWKKGPGAGLFRRLKMKFPDLPIIAEDLGEIDQPVYDLMDKYHLPGMRVLLFAFGDGMPKSPYIPHNHVENAVVYTGTHDNNTVRGWYENHNSHHDKERFHAYLGHVSVNADNVSDHMVRLALSSVAKLAVVPMQDFLGLGEEAVMNRPSTAQGNWIWRMHPGAIHDGLTQKVRKMLAQYDRLKE